MTDATTPTPGWSLALTTRPPRVARRRCDGLHLHRPSELFLVVHQDRDRVGGSASVPGRHAETSTLNVAPAMAAESATAPFPQLRVRLARLDPDGRCAVIDPRPGYDSPSDLDSCKQRTTY